MADDVDVRFLSAIEKLRKVCEISGNLRKDLKQSIFEAISELNSVQNDYKKCIINLKDDIKTTTSEQVIKPITKGSYASVASTLTASGDLRERQGRQLHSAFIRSLKNQNSEEIKTSLKERIDPERLQIGIERLKVLNEGKLVISCKDKHDLDKLCNAVKEQFNEDLSIEPSKKILPQIIIFNIPEELGDENAESIIINQNQDVIKNDVFKVKFIRTAKNKNSRFLVAEVSPGIRKTFLDGGKGGGVKINWRICRCSDYINIKRCYQCNKFSSHDSSSCKSQVICPLCSGNHILRDCANRNELKCSNCLNYNRFVKNGHKYSVNHAALDRNCPIYLKHLHRRKQNIDYGE